LKKHITRKKHIRLALFVTILVVCVALMAVFREYRQVSNPEKFILSAIQDEASISIGNVNHTSTKNGIKEWNLQAESGHYIEKDKLAVFDNLLATFYMQNGNMVRMSARKGYLNTQSNDIRVTGNIVAVDGDFKIETDKLRYKNKRRMLYADSPVKVTGNAMSLVADSASYDLNSQKAVFEGKVEGIIFENITL
jgi:LPS export ABC transporter protein LptC